MTYPTDRKYTKDHEWIRLIGEAGQVGITNYAQEQLGSVVYVELPDVGASFSRGAQCGSIESVKAVSDIFCPVSGEVVEVNARLVNEPELINAEPHDSWLIVLKLVEPSEVDGLMDANAYGELVA